MNYIRTLLFVLFLSYFSWGQQEIDKVKDINIYANPIKMDNDNPLRREIEFMKERLYPNDFIPDNARVNAIKQMERMFYDAKNSKAMLLAQQPEWKNIGPFNIGGRIKTIACHPTKQNTVYIGAAAGGIWKTTDGGSNWTPIFDYENGIAFGSISIDKNNPDVIYAGTGEAVLGSSVIYLGAGLYKSTNGGDSWKLLGLTEAGAFSKVYVHPKNSNLIVAGVVRRGQGFYKSVDGGLTWKKTFTGSVSDVSINNQNENEFVIGVIGSGIYYSGDGGETWQERNSGLDANIGRVSVQFSQANPDYLYALMEIGGLGYLYYSENRGKSWILNYTGTSGFFNGQGFYNNYIITHPTDQYIALAGGIDIFRKTKNQQWMNQTNGYGGGNVHVDQHCADYDPFNSNIIYAGNDGGMYKSYDGGVSWQEINNNLQVTQFYHFTIDPRQENLNFGGTQDNGTLGNNSGGQWRNIVGGDGFGTLLQPDDSNILYGFSTPSGNIVPFKLNLKTGSFQFLSSGLTLDDVWDPPLAIDPVDNSIMYHGRGKFYVSYEYGNNWIELKTPVKQGRFTAIDVSSVDEAVIYAGTSMGMLIVTTDGGNKWDVISTNGLVNRWIKDIATSRKNLGTVYVTMSGYGTSHVFKSENFGQTWIDIGKGLPDVPVNTIALHPKNENMLFVGTDIGVFASFDGGATWFPYGRGMARSPVTDIGFSMYHVNQPAIKLRAATHGRSIWETDVKEEIITDPEITNPAGGEIFTSNTNQTVSWYGFVPPVRVEYSVNDGESWTLIADNVIGNSLLWNLPNRESIYCRIRVSSKTEQSQIKISNTFTIKLKKIGSVLKYSGVSFTPYGICWDGKNSLWASSYYTNQLVKINAETFLVEKEFELPAQAGAKFFTDITMDRNNGLLYIHRLNDSTGNGGVIVVVDTNANYIRRMTSPGKAYPIGLEFVDGNLIVGDRDMRNEYQQRVLMVVNPQTGQVISSVANPFNVYYGPRGICYDGSQYLYQVSTEFSTSSSFVGAYNIKISKNDLTKEVSRFTLESIDGLINARGIDYDSRDENFWITDLGGNIYKVAGFNTKLSNEEVKKENAEILTKIYPNPTDDYSIVSFSCNFTGDLQISVHDLLGNKIKLIYDKYLVTGESDYAYINTINLSSGSYSLVYTINGKIIKTEKMFVIK